MKAGNFGAKTLVLTTLFLAGPVSAQVLECTMESDHDNYAVADCTGSHPYVTGGGFYSSAINGAVGAGPTIADAYEVDYPGSTSGFAWASCCNAATGNTSTFSSGNVATASCGSAVAVGGGGFCTDPTAKITFSHPLPYPTGSTPHQWTVRCSKPGVWAYASCAEDDVYDTCRVQRVTSSGSVATAACFDDEIATSTGAWCGSGYVRAMNYGADLAVQTASCSGSNTHAFAVCCEGYFAD